MASLSNYGGAAQNLANIGLEGSDMTADTGLAQTRLMRNYSTRMLPDLVNRYAAKGTFYGGQAGYQADQLKEDVGNQYGDLQRNLQRQLAGLRRAGVLAAMGVVI